MLNGKPNRTDNMTRAMREEKAPNANMYANSVIYSGSSVTGLPGVRRIVMKFNANDEATMTATIACHPRENCSTAR